MKLEIATKKENKALQRKEVILKVGETKLTPSRKELLPKIAAVLDTKEQLVVINKISHPFGSREATVEASVYENENALNTVAKHLIERGKGKKKKEEEKKAKAKEPAKEEKKGEAKEEKPEKKEKKPAEEKKEEKPQKKEEKPTEKENKEADK